jgi:hypothetical protein
MFFTQDEVSTWGFWLVDYKGASEDDVDGLEDGWDSFWIWERGSLGKLVALNGMTFIWLLIITFSYG